MSAPDLLLAIDQGTTSTRAIAFGRDLQIAASASRRLELGRPQPGWVEVDPEALLASVVDSVGDVLLAVGGAGRIAAAGLDNQGETVVAWDQVTGVPLAPAVVWQCKRSGAIVDRLREAGQEPAIRELSGLPLDPYFSAGKMTWLIENVPGVRRALQAGRLRLGTVDSWIVDRLGGGFITDVSTASRTQLLGLGSLTWSDRLLDTFGVSREALPRIGPTVGTLGRIGHERWGGDLPLTAMACDQQAALAGHGAFRAGAIKATYGTGVFVLANAGTSPGLVDGLETSVAWMLADGMTQYVLQGGVLTAGTLVDWLSGDLGLIAEPADSDRLARSVPDTAGVRVLPALAGVGAPWYRPEARGVISGLTPGAGRAHLVRAALDGIANRVVDVVEAMLPALPERPSTVRVDGGLTANEYLCQRQADLLGLPIEAVATEESTALGIAGLAGIGAGWLTPDAIATVSVSRRRYEPSLAATERAMERAAWRRFVEAASLL